MSSSPGTSRSLGRAFTEAPVAAWRVAFEARGFRINVRITAVRKLAVEVAADNVSWLPSWRMASPKGVASKACAWGTG